MRRHRGSARNPEEPPRETLVCHREKLACHTETMAASCSTAPFPTELCPALPMEFQTDSTEEAYSAKVPTRKNHRTSAAQGSSGGGPKIHRQRTGPWAPSNRQAQGRVARRQAEEEEEHLTAELGRYARYRSPARWLGTPRFLGDWTRVGSRQGQRDINADQERFLSGGG